MSDPIGRRGETAVATILGRPFDGKVKFDAKFLGAKNEVYDFSVSLVDDSGLDLGPFFLLQVKSTSRSELDRPIKISFSEHHVKKSHESKVPAYLVAVDVSTRLIENAYFVAIEANQESGIWSIPRTHDMGCDQTAIMLYNEVIDCFSSKPYNFESQFTLSNKS